MWDKGVDRGADNVLMSEQALVLRGDSNLNVLLAGRIWG
jgi:hypothetical protein